MWTDFIFGYSGLLLLSIICFILIFGGIRGRREGFYYERMDPIDIWTSRTVGTLILCAGFGAAYIGAIKTTHTYWHPAFIVTLILGFLVAIGMRRNP